MAGATAELEPKDGEPLPGIPERLATKGDVARMFSVTTQTISMWVRQGRLPQPIVIGKTKYWTPEVLRTLLGGGGGA